MEGGKGSGNGDPLFPFLHSTPVTQFNAMQLKTATATWKTRKHDDFDFQCEITRNRPVRRIEICSSLYCVLPLISWEFHENATQQSRFSMMDVGARHLVSPPFPFTFTNLSSKLFRLYPKEEGNDGSLSKPSHQSNMCTQLCKNLSRPISLLTSNVKTSSSIALSLLPPSLFSLPLPSSPPGCC